MDASALTLRHQVNSRRAVIAGIAAVGALYFAWRIAEAWVSSPLSPGRAAHTAPSVAHAAAHPAPPAVYSVAPFAALLLAIAVLPLFRRTAHWWEHNVNRFRVSAAMAGVTLAYYAFVYGEGVVDHSTHELSAAGLPAALAVLKNAILVEYVPFITLLFSLYVISGGILIEGDLVGRPKLNAGLIGLGGLLASLIGTTGAAMLLIRPLLRANAGRQYVAHTVVFFIFVACNTGGCLLPIGDPPLFLGFLRGVPFTWTLSLWPMWLFMNSALLATYFVWDTIRYRQEAARDARPARRRVRIRGAINVVWLLGVIGCVALLDPSRPVPGTAWHPPVYGRELVMLGLAAASLWTTSVRIRQKNAFSYTAIIEVAALFVGIFVCMQAPVQLLDAYGGSLGIDRPWEFYWGTGTLSSFLDNAPTYVVFFETARSLGASGPAVAGVNGPILVAISLGAVFMGAMTYIGNGPNFIVKSIAESANVRMPGFFGYMAYSGAVLLPLSAVLTLVFLL
ncbi:MAG TPA: sodium:proton antiporter [Planctomycetaceae bacterium]|nr:sodium:proton antiporter [Planctomycetaceae bacterium]